MNLFFVMPSVKSITVISAGMWRKNIFYFVLLRQE